jgi:pantetheine-phosphate adenylyltransferase
MHRKRSLVSHCDASVSMKRPREFRVVAVGGTFDLVHKGHRKLLDTAFQLGETVMIGVTSDRFVKKLHKPHKVDSYEVREKELKKLLKRRNWLGRSTIVSIEDPYGPTTKEDDIDALVVSQRTEPTAELINRLRRRKGLRPLHIVPITLVQAEDSRPISTTRIRRGRIDREGRILVRPS